MIATVLPSSEGFAPDTAGAIGLLVHRLATAGGTATTVVGAGGFCAPFEDVSFQPVPRMLGFSRAGRYRRGVIQALRRLRPSLVEVHNRPALALALARRFAPLPVILFLHNDPQAMRDCRTAAQRRRVLARLARVVVVSAYLRARLLDGVARPPKLPALLPNCIVPDTAPVSAAGGRDRLILFVGRVVADKGADLFVQSCARVLPGLPGWRAEMIGADRPGPARRDTPFLRRVRVDAERAGVVLHGYQPHGAVLAAMRRAAIVVVPSRWAEPFGLTALEAMACGAALICSDRGGLAEVTGDAALLLDPELPGSLDSALRTLALDPYRRAALGAAGRIRAQRFSAEAALALLQDIRRDAA